MEILIILVLAGLAIFGIYFAVMSIKAQNAYKDKLTSKTPVTDYSPTTRIGDYISADFQTKRWRPEVVKNAKIWSFSDIVNANILVDGSSVAHGYKTTASNIIVRISMSHPDMKLLDILVMSVPNTDVNSFLFKQSMNNAEQIKSLIDSMLSEKGGATNSVTTDTAAELRKLKELLDDGIITQEDFDAKKAKLLDL